MEISNLFTLVGVFVTVAAHLVIISSILSKHMGKTEECIRSTNQRVDLMQHLHDNCPVKERLTEAEKKQEKLRNEWPERLARIEQDVKEVKKQIEEMKDELREHYGIDRKGKHDRYGDT